MGAEAEAEFERCEERNAYRNRCRLEVGHDGPCIFRAARPVAACPGCGRVHRGPRCLTGADRRVSVTVHIRSELLDRLDERVGHERFGTARRDGIEAALAAWLDGGGRGGVTWRSEDCP